MLTTLYFVIFAATPPPPRVQWGIGVESPLVGGPQLELVDRSYRLPSLAATLALRQWIGVQLITGVGWQRVVTQAPIELTVDRVLVAGTFRVIAWPVRRRSVRLGVVAGAGASGGIGGTHATAAPNTRREFALSTEVGIRPEWRVSPHLSLHAQAGVGYVFASTNTATTTMGIVAGGWTSALGVTFWF